MTENAYGKAAVAAAAGLLLTLGACGSRPSTGPAEEVFGAAVRHNIAVQVVEPDPQPSVTPPPQDGSKAARGISRYKTDNVKKPRELRTSGVGG